jgi:hypothetical protein
MTFCLSSAELILSQLSGRGFAPASARPEHVRGCAWCGARAEALRQLLSPGAAPDGPCLDTFQFAEILDAVTDRAVEDAKLTHLSRCDHCRDELAALEAIVRDPSVRAELNRPERFSRVAPIISHERRPWGVATGVLAAAAVMLFAVRAFSAREYSPAPGSSTFRHATIEVAAAPRLIVPMGAVVRLDSLTWTSVPKADRYRVTVFDPSGQTAWETELSDTSVAVRAAESSRWTGVLRWRVKARMSFDRWIDSDFGEFTIRREGR